MNSFAETGFKRFQKSSSFKLSSLANPRECSQARSLAHVHFRPFPHSRNVNVSSWPLAAGSPAPLRSPTTTICFLPTQQFTLSRIPHKRAPAVHSGSGFFDLACFGGPPCHSHWQLFLSVLNGVIPYMDGPWFTHSLTRRYWVVSCGQETAGHNTAVNVHAYMFVCGFWKKGDGRLATQWEQGVEKKLGGGWGRHAGSCLCPQPPSRDTQLVALNKRSEAGRERKKCLFPHHHGAGKTPLSTL